MTYDINNWLRFPYGKKPLADSTLRNKTKAELIQILRDYEHNYAALYDANERGIKAAQEMLPKKGKWIRPVPGDGEPYCSECKREAMYGHPSLWSHVYLTDFCPHCGADMRVTDIGVGSKSEGNQ